jgi:hypothetical protein
MLRHPGFLNILLPRPTKELSAKDLQGLLNVNEFREKNPQYFTNDLETRAGVDHMKS